MKIAALYDIHGNWPALEAVLDEVSAEGADQIVIGGDVVPGPMPRECLDALSALKIAATFIVGNGDRETVAIRHGQMSAVIPEFFREAMRWNAAQLTDADERAIGGWPPTTMLRVPAIGNVLFCHATPRNDVEIFTERTAEEKLRPIFDPLGVDLVVCGHTHMQFDRRVGRTRIVNAGSVGMPFEDPGAYWLLIGASIELRRTAYDLTVAATRVRATAYPLAAQFAGSYILQTPSKQSTLDAFATAELT